MVTPEQNLVLKQSDNFAVQLQLNEVDMLLERFDYSSAANLYFVCFFWILNLVDWGVYQTWWLGSVVNFNPKLYFLPWKNTLLFVY